MPTFLTAHNGFLIIACGLFEGGCACTHTKAVSSQATGSFGVAGCDHSNNSAAFQWICSSGFMAVDAGLEELNPQIICIVLGPNCWNLHLFISGVEFFFFNHITSEVQLNCGSFFFLFTSCQFIVLLGSGDDLPLILIRARLLRCRFCSVVQSQHPSHLDSNDLLFLLSQGRCSPLTCTYPRSSFLFYINLKWRMLLW